MPGNKFKYNILQENAQLRVIGKSKVCRQCIVISVVVSIVAALVLAVALIVSLTEGASHHIEKNECAFPTSERFDCLAGVTPSKDKCESLGCCWRPDVDSNTPKCFYSIESGYMLSGNYTNIPLGVHGELKRSSEQQSSHHGEDLQQLRVNVLYETEHRLHIKVSKVQTSAPPPL